MTSRRGFELSSAIPSTTSPRYWLVEVREIYGVRRGFLVRADARPASEDLLERFMAAATVVDLNGHRVLVSRLDLKGLSVVGEAAGGREIGASPRFLIGGEAVD